MADAVCTVTFDEPANANRFTLAAMRAFIAALRDAHEQGAAVLVLRADAQHGALAVLWLLAVVWSTDIAAYFCGRLIGGPKLWPSVSPNKTWSGSIGGALFGTIAGLVTLHLAGVPLGWPAAPVALMASIVSQGGDLFESSMKRRFGVKDSGHLIPGHGGLMDRLDGFIAAAAFALVVGLLRDPATPAAGLLVW